MRDRSTTGARSVILRIELTALDERDGHVQGTVAADGGEPVGFTGWLNLLELLERSADLGIPT